jgi:hypothetical protein
MIKVGRRLKRVRGRSTTIGSNLCAIRQNDHMEIESELHKNEVLDRIGAYQGGKSGEKE